MVAVEKRTIFLFRCYGPNSLNAKKFWSKDLLGSFLVNAAVHQVSSREILKIEDTGWFE